MLKLSNIMIGSGNIEAMKEFYKKFLGAPVMDEDGWLLWEVGGTMISLSAHSEVKDKAKEPQRIILNFEVTDVKAEFEKVKALGATVIKEPYDAGEGHWVCTFADPDGNYLQYATPWEN